jgi:hypothetical protein
MVKAILGITESSVVETCIYSKIILFYFLVGRLKLFKNIYYFGLLLEPHN